jgi:cephalosporin-C deacetylase-like acetyl esterase
LEYYDPGTGKSAAGSPTHEHSYPGVQAFITGSSLARYMIWDGIRAVDYLLTRKEVDPGRIGITGRSGGGTQSAYIAAFDDRIYAAAPENYITSFTRLLQSIGPQDAEQNMLYGILRGLDHADLLEVRAPRPALMITTTRDMFSIQGAMETAGEVSRIYKAYGKEENFRRAEDDTTHSTTKKNREAVYAFFQKHLRNPGDSTDLDIQSLPEEELRATPTGQLATSLKSETVFSINSREAEKLISKLQGSRKNIATHLPAVIKSARVLSGYREPAAYHTPVFAGRYLENGHVLEKYFVQGEGDYVIPYLLMVPDHPNGKAVLCLNPSGKSAEASTGDMQWLISKGFTVMAPDMIGTGELGPGYFQGDSFFNNTSYGIWYLSVLTGRSIAGIRAADVVRLAGILKKNDHAEEIYGIAKKEMAPVLLYAAAFDRSISRVALIDPYVSYRSVVMNSVYQPGFIFGAVPGALESFDLPDIEAALAPRKLLIAGITDGNRKLLTSENAETDLSVIRSAYRYKNADNNLKIIYGDTGKRVHELLEDWIK